MIQVSYFIIDDDREIAYFPETRRFFFVNDEMKALISAILEKEKTDVIHQFGISEAEYDSFLGKMRLPKAAEPEQPDRGQRALNRLILHLSNDCNLRCVYCYANGGHYRTERDLMSKEMLDRIIDVIYREYEHVDRIQFFGGEPLLNMELIDHGCRRMREIEQRRGNKIDFGIVVNGTLINDRFIELVKEHNIVVTVSYDGDPAINDRLRPFPNGKGSSEIILRNIQKLKEATGQPSTIEATYTTYHADAGISPLDVVEKIRARFSDMQVHIVPASGSCDCDFILQDLRMFPASIAEICNRTLEQPDKPVPMYMTASQFFEELDRKDTPFRRYICDAGIGTLSVTTKGNIYPCFMLTDIEELKLGNVREEDVFHNERYRAVQSRILAHSCKENHEECRNCFASTLCNGCLGADYLTTGKPFLLSKLNCDMNRAMVEEAIKGQAKLYEQRKKRNNEAKKNDETV